MKLFHKEEFDQNDQEKFPNTFEKFNSLKHNTEEVNRMCEKIESYAEERAHKREIESAIRSYAECGLNKEEIQERIIKRFNLTEEKAIEYYENIFSVAQS